MRLTKSIAGVPVSLELAEFIEKQVHIRSMMATTAMSVRSPSRYGNHAL
jgi:hypothetical protein